MGTILVADDNRGFAELLRATLEEAGFDVLTASTGPAAMACVEQNDVDAAVLDILMPGMSGDAVAERLRQIAPGLPVLLMTGSSGGFAAGSGLPPPQALPAGSARRGRAPPRRAVADAMPARGDVKLSSADRVLFPDDGITKGDLFAYYERVAPVLVPHLRDRPFTMKRFREGIAGDGFFQKQAPKGMPVVDPDAALHDAPARRRCARSGLPARRTPPKRCSGWCRCTAST